MRQDISEPVRQYAHGEITMDQALDMLRQVTPAPYESSNPWSNEAIQHEGNFVDLISACMIYDLPAEVYGHFRRALYATPIGGTPADTTDVDAATRPDKGANHGEPTDLAKGA